MRIYDAQLRRADPDGVLDQTNVLN